jgi:hypothetical protein
MVEKNDNAQGDIVGWAIQVIIIAILIWLFFFVIYPALVAVTPK